MTRVTFLLLTMCLATSSFELDSLQPLIDQFSPSKYVYMYDSSSFTNGLVAELLDTKSASSSAFNVYLYDLDSIRATNLAARNATYYGYYDWNIIYCRLLSSSSYEDSTGSNSSNLLFILDDVSIFLKVSVSLLK